MKKHNAVYLFLSILEGMLSGGYIYLAKREKDHLNLLTGLTLMVLSIFHGMMSIPDDDDEDDDFIWLEGEDDE